MTAVASVVQVVACVPRTRCPWIVRSRGTRDPTGRLFPDFEIVNVRVHNHPPREDAA